MGYRAQSPAPPLINGHDIDYQRELNQEQLAVVLHGDGPCLVLAGAGSGKTRTIVYRVAHLLECGVAPARILLLTFTNKAAHEMMGRVSRLCPKPAPGAGEIYGGTFHASANRILRRVAPELGYTSSFTILDQADALTLLKLVMQELSLDSKARRFPTASVIHSIVSLARNTASSIETVLELKHAHFLNFSGEIEELARLYQQRKLQANAMDFDDLLINWLTVMKHERLGQAIAQQFQYILVDEYQDTNALQAAIVYELGKAHSNVLVVGDDAQSIYAFRGADIQNILQFPSQWPKVNVFTLLTNYRSVPDILDLANDSLAHNARQFEKVLVGVQARGQRPTLVTAASAWQEAQFIAEQILMLREQGLALPSLAVLFRSAAHSQALEFELTKRDIPYEYRGGMKFFERAHIKDVLAYLRICNNLADETAWLRALNLHAGIGAVTALRIARAMQSLVSPRDVLSAVIEYSLVARAAQGWRDFVSRLDKILDEPTQPALMLRAVLAAGYQDYLEREYPDWRERVEDLEQLALLAEAYQDLSSFLSDLTLVDDVLVGRERETKSREDRLVLSTIHQAKGLEWDTVFLIHLTESAFPNRYALAEEGGVEEERRLFYVAVTRARRRLFLTYPATFGEGGVSLNRPSRFLEELSPRLVEHINLTAATSSLRRQSNTWAKHEAAEDTFDGSGADWDEPTIQLDRAGEKASSATSSVWKSSSSKPPSEVKRRTFLREVEDL